MVVFDVVFRLFWVFFLLWVFVISACFGFFAYFGVCPVWVFGLFVAYWKFGVWCFDGFACSRRVVVLRGLVNTRFYCFAGL